MTKRSLLPQHPRHILIYDEDWEFLQAEYGPDGAVHIGVSSAIRTIIHSYVTRLKAKANEAFDRQTRQQLETTGDEEQTK